MKKRSGQEEEKLPQVRTERLTVYRTAGHLRRDSYMPGKHGNEGIVKKSAPEP
jgi:hypothetical protein